MVISSQWDWTVTSKHKEKLTMVSKFSQDLEVRLGGVSTAPRSTTKQSSVEVVGSLLLAEHTTFLFHARFFLLPRYFIPTRAFLSTSAHWRMDLGLKLDFLPQLPLVWNGREGLGRTGYSPFFSPPPLMSKDTSM